MNHTPYSIDDLFSGAELLSMKIGYCPQIDAGTRRILAGLAQDLYEYRGTIDMMNDMDGFEMTLFMEEVLRNILNRTPENTHLPESVLWLGREK
ncbi:MAG: hypothetical protein AWU57_1663 [Marinobacter sp. T13-3]|nr:MAG: hypothetical protein AWU57_1663 [Marinobacter sp. T13-3]